MTDRICGTALHNNEGTPANRARPPIVFDESRGWRSCWGRFQCFASRKREISGRRGTQLITGGHTSQNNVESGSIALDVLNQRAVLSPMMRAPPSSPASVQLVDDLHSLPSPAALLTLFPMKSGNDCGQSSLHTDSNPINAAAGSFSIDGVLVTPPINSTLTTELNTPLSTAPFTPPPELAHLTTPPSPDVPFAELLASSLNIKCSLPEKTSEHYPLKALPPSNIDFVYQLYPGSPIGQLVSPRSGASSSGTASPLPERVSSLENVASVTSTSVLKNGSFFGFGCMGLANMCHANDAQVLQQDIQYIQKDQQAQTESNVSEKINRLQMASDCNHLFFNDELMEQCPLVLASGNQGTQVESAGRTPKFNEHCLSSCKELSLDTVPEQLAISTDMSIERGDQGSMNLTHFIPGRSDTKEQLGESACQIKSPYLSHLIQNPSFEQSLSDIHGKRHGFEVIDNEACCSACGELTSKCRELSEALQKTKEKLVLVERRENLIDDRERKYKQVIRWMQLGAKSQQESISQLSEELSWQQESFMDLQGQHLAGLGIDLPEVSREV